MKLFALHGSEDFGSRIAQHLRLAVSQHEEREFEDGEHKIRPLENVRNQDVFVVHSLYSDEQQSVNDKLCRLLFFISTLRDASAKKVTAVVPYLCYARKDRRTKPRDPVTTRYLARLFEAAGAAAFVTMDVHNLQAFQNSFSIPAENLEAKFLFVPYLQHCLAGENLVVLSPDFGGAKRAELLLNTLRETWQKDVSFALMEKYRSGGVISGEQLIGDVRNKTVIIIDDLISTGSTMARAAAACCRQGAKRVLALATHGLFTGNAPEVLLEPALQTIVVTNTVPAFRLTNAAVKEKLVVLDAAPIFAEAIRRMVEGGSISALLQNN